MTILFDSIMLLNTCQRGCRFQGKGLDILDLFLCKRGAKAAVSRETCDQNIGSMLKLPEGLLKEVSTKPFFSIGVALQ